MFFGRQGASGLDRRPDLLSRMPAHFWIRTLNLDVGRTTCCSSRSVVVPRRWLSRWSVVLAVRHRHLEMLEALRRPPHSMRWICSRNVDWLSPLRFDCKTRGVTKAICGKLAIRRLMNEMMPRFGVTKCHEMLSI